MRTFDLLGYIVPDDDAWVYRFFGYAVTSPMDVRNALKKAGKEPVTVRINSYGGDVWSAPDMYTLLRQHEPGVETEVTGLAASAATLPMTAGNTVRASPTAEIMIHNPSCSASGDHRAMEHTAQSLRNTREAIINAYELKSGLSRERLRGMMNSETWMTAQRALENGFVDEILFAEDGKMANEPPEGGEAEGAPAAKVASINLPSADVLKARWAVWNELAPGAKSIDEAREMLMSRAGEPVKPSNEPECKEPEAQEAKTQQMDMLKARISVLAT